MHPSVPSRAPACALALVIALAGLLAVTPPAAADCEESVAQCSTQHDETYTVPASIRQVSAILPVRTDDDEGLSGPEIYRALLPDDYDVPGPLQVAVSATRFDTPRTEAGTTGAVPAGIVTTLALRVEHDGEQGWYPISQATTSTDAYDFGRSVGLPVHMAEASFSPDGDGTTVAASVEDQQSFALSWQPADLNVGEDNLTWMQRSEPFFALRSPLEGPDRSRVKITHKPPVPVLDVIGAAPGQLEVDDVTDHAPPSKGHVRVQLDPDPNRLDAASPEPLPDLPFPEGTGLGDLVSLDQEVPGLLWETDTEVIVQADNLDDGQDGQVPGLPDAPLPAAHTAALAGPGATNTGYATPVLATTEGSTMDFANVDTATHNVVSLDLGPDGRPLFSSPLTNTGETSAVEGVADLPPGTYGFLCTIHPNMQGQLTIG